MTGLRAGRLRHRVDVHRRAAPPGGAGVGPGVAEPAFGVVHAGVPAEVTHRSGGTETDDGRAESEDEYRVVMRHLPGLTVADRIVHAGAVLEVGAVVHCPDRVKTTATCWVRP